MDSQTEYQRFMSAKARSDLGAPFDEADFALQQEWRPTKANGKHTLWVLVDGEWRMTPYVRFK